MQVFITKNYRYILIILVAIITIMAFYMGTLYANENSREDNIIISCSDEILTNLSIPLQDIYSGQNKISQNITEKGQYFGSKNGTKYYTPNCTAGNRIKPENIIWFENAEDATLQGYSPANC